MSYALGRRSAPRTWRIDLSERLDSRSVLVAFVLVAPLLCAIFMPAMGMMAMAACGVAILVAIARPRTLDRVEFRLSERLKLGAAASVIEMDTGPPCSMPLKNLVPSFRRAACPFGQDRYRKEDVMSRLWALPLIALVTGRG